LREHRRGSQALINSKHEKFDLVFADVELGNHQEGGLTVGKLVGEARSSVPVLYASGRLPTDGMKSLFVKRSAFLPKPYTAYNGSGGRPVAEMSDPVELVGRLRRVGLSLIQRTN
jgi:hypothetical protein